MFTFKAWLIGGNFLLINGLTALILISLKNWGYLVVRDFQHLLRMKKPSQS